MCYPVNRHMQRRHVPPVYAAQGLRPLVQVGAIPPGLQLYLRHQFPEAAHVVRRDIKLHRQN